MSDNSITKNKGGQAVKINATSAILRVILAITLVLGLMPSFATTNAFAADASTPAKMQTTTSAPAADKAAPAADGEAALTGQYDITVKFDTNGGTPSTIADMTAVWGDSGNYLESAPPTVTQEGFTLTGWSVVGDDDEDTIEETDLTSVDFFEYDTDGDFVVSIKAIWTQNTPTETKTAFATLATDGSLNFYYREGDAPSVGDTFDGKTVKAVYNDIVGTVYSTSSSTAAPWYASKSDITSVNVVDSGVPMPSGAVFYGLNNITKLDLSNFDATKATEITKMFSGCSNLRELNISSFDTSKWTAPSGTSAASGTNTGVFSSCNCLGKITVGANYAWKMGTYSAASPGYGNLSNPTAGLYQNNNEDFKGKYLTGKWVDTANTEYSSINDIPASTAGTYTWQVDESQSKLYVKFDANGGYINSKNESYDAFVTSGETATWPSTNTIENLGYTFDNWYTDEALTQVWDPSAAITQNVVIRAKWNKKEIPENWTKDDFTYSVDGKQITGLTDTGKIRIKNGQEMDLGVADPGLGVDITEIAAASTSYGTFGFSYGGETLTPTAVKNIPSTVTTIGSKAFYKFGGSSIELPEGLSFIADNAFYYAQQLTSIKIPSTVSYLGSQSFSGCTSLATIEFATGEDGTSECESIPSKAFYNAPVTSLTLAEGLKTISDNAFYNAYKTLKEVWLPTTLTTLGKAAFAYSNQTTKVACYVTTQDQLDNNSGIITDGNGHTVKAATKYTVKFDLNGHGDEGTQPADQTLALESGSTDKIAPTKPENPTDESGYTFCCWNQKAEDGTLTKWDFADTNLNVPDAATFDADTNTLTLYAKWISPNWSAEDFTWEENDEAGTAKVTGLSDAGVARRANDKNIIIPEKSPNGNDVTEIAAAGTDDGGLFATSTEKINSVELPSTVTKIGDNAFRAAGLTSVTFSEALAEIGASAFLNNSLTEVILPDACLTIGAGAFATNPTIEKITLPSQITEIPEACFGCSDASNYMTKLTEITIPETVTKIGARAFAGNNFKSIEIPSKVKEIGDYAFSTKNYLMDEGEVTLTLPEGLETIGKYAFRNKAIASVELPTTVEALPDTAFLKEYSGGQEAIITKVIVTTDAQYNDTENFPRDCEKSHKIVRVYIVTFNANGGTDVEAAKVESGEKVEEPSTSKEGYTLDGWFTDEALTQAFSFSTVVTSDLTLYAKWTAKVEPTPTPDPATETVAVYRLYNQYSGEHLFTTNEKEQKDLIGMGWTDEGTGWQSPASSQTAVYRLYNPYTGDHHYTANKTEKDDLVGSGWNDEGAAFLSAEETAEGAVKVYRQFNPYATVGTHNFTTNETEKDYICGIGWNDEGVAWYAVEAEATEE